MAITKKHVYSFIFLAIFSVIQLIIISAPTRPVLADETLFNSQTGMTNIGGVYGNNKTDLRITIAKIVQFVLGFLGVIFLGLMLFAGFRFMTAAGNKEQSQKALAQIKDATIGLVIILSAWAISEFIITRLGNVVANKPNL